MSLTNLRGRQETGATLVEMAIVMPIFFGLIFVIIELGLAFNVKLVVDDGVQSAARVGAGVGNGLDADLYILDELLDQVSDLPNNGVGILSHVEIYRVNADGSPDMGALNRYFYTWTVSTTDCDWNPCPKGTSIDVPNKPEWDEYVGGYGAWNWKPEDRSVAVGDLDAIGVKAYFSHRFLTGFLPIDDPLCDTPVGNPTNCWTEDTIMRLEPLQFSVGSS
jgi:hypothetical protein